MEIARDYNLWVIEDCAQSHFATIGSQKAGTFDMAAFLSSWEEPLCDGRCWLSGYQ